MLALSSAARAEIVTWSNWSGIGTLTSSQVGNVATFTEVSPGTPFGTHFWTATATVINGGNYTFDYNFRGFFAFFNVRAGLDAIDNAGTHSILAEGPASCGACNPPSGGFNYSGSYTFIGLAANEVIRFRTYGSNGDSNRTMDSTLRLTQVVPEPMSLALVGLALFGAAVSTRRKA